MSSSASSGRPPNTAGSDEEALPRLSPLHGVRILDLSQFLAGPFCTQILADLGAEVIKIEPPSGDPTRTIPPYFYRGEGAYFLSINRSKESVVLDLTSPGGRSVFCDLARQADVVVENFRPGITKKLGVDYDALRAITPRIIYCSISGFGQDGPSAQRPAYDMIVQALSGGMSLTGETGGRPLRSGIPIGDLNAGQFAVIAILAALRERDRSGVGQFVDIAMLDVQIAMLCYMGVYYLLSDVVPGPQGRGHTSIPTYTAFRARDGREVLITANTERMWRQLCKALEIEELADDPRFATNEQRLVHRSELEPILEREFGARDSEPLLERLQELGVPCARVNTVAEALAEPQVVHRRMVREVPHTLGGSIRVLGNPIKFSRSADTEFTSPPTLGEHTETVLSHVLGYSASQIGELRASGAFGSSPREGTS